MTVLQVRRLTKKFGGLVAVDGVDLEIRQGELLGLFGPNGAGKTTLFNLISGSLRPDAGDVFFLGEPITHLPPHARARKGIARTFQLVQVFGELTVLENVLVALARRSLQGWLPLRRYDTPDRRQTAMQLLEIVGLAPRALEHAKNLPLGLLKRLEVARAMALRPMLLLVDEPLAGLNPGEAEQLLSVLVALRNDTSIMLVEHNVRLALPVCDRAVAMDAGRVIAQGTPEEVRRDPRVVEAYLGAEYA